jgi:hypothetical protein
MVLPARKPAAIRPLPPDRPHDLDLFDKREYLVLKRFRKATNGLGNITEWDHLPHVLIYQLLIFD